MKPGISLLFSAVALAGCASVPVRPEVASVTLVPVSSASIEVHRPRFKIKDGDLKLEAYALRQWTAHTTADTHIDLVYLDATGKQLAIESTNFSPRSLPKTTRLPAPHGYLLASVKLPAGTRAIEVRAHDGVHDAIYINPAR